MYSSVNDKNERMYRLTSSDQDRMPIPSVEARPIGLSDHFVANQFVVSVYMRREER